MKLQAGLLDNMAKTRKILLNACDLCLKSAIVQHRSQNPGPELDLKKQVWTNHRPGLNWPGLEYSDYEFDQI